MPSLHERQAKLAAAIREPSVPASDGLRVYHHAYRARLQAALATHYPVLAGLLGEEAFAAFASAYATQFPSRHWSIRWHGEHFDAMMPPGPLADLARMEWALDTSFDAADEEPVPETFLMRVPVDRWGDLSLALHPSVRVLLLDWAIEPLWTAARDRPGEKPADPEPDRHALIAWRAEHDVRWRSASLGEGEALLHLHDGGSLDAAAEGLSARDAEALGGWLAGWVRQGLLVSPERAR